MKLAGTLVRLRHLVVTRVSVASPAPVPRFHMASATDLQMGSLGASSDRRLRQEGGTRLIGLPRARCSGRGRDSPQRDPGFRARRIADVHRSDQCCGRGTARADGQGCGAMAMASFA
jgi:hypothetical protein